VILLALAGPWLALGFLLVMQQIERWLDESPWQDAPPPARADARSADISRSR
jgi:hypothetical protein